MIWCRSWASAVRLVAVSVGRRVHSPRSATSSELLGDSGDRGRDRVAGRCRRIPLSYREFWHRPPTFPAPEPASIPASCGQASSMFLEHLDMLGSRHSLAGARCSTTGEANHCPAAPGSRPRPRAVSLPLLRISITYDLQPRRSGLDTRSLALAARPPAWPTTAMPHPARSPDPAPYLLLAALLDHPRPATAREWSRHSLAGARCSTTGGLSLALAARPPESSNTSTRWCQQTADDHRVEGVWLRRRARGSASPPCVGREPARQHGPGTGVVRGLRRPAGHVGRLLAGAPVVRPSEVSPVLCPRTEDEAQPNASRSNEIRSSTSSSTAALSTDRSLSGPVPASCSRRASRMCSVPM